MRRLWVVVCAATLVAAVLAAPASATSDSVSTPSDGADRQTAAAPQSFRWVPYPGLPQGVTCELHGNDRGSSLVLVGRGADVTLWRATASGTRQLFLPVGTQLALDRFTDSSTSFSVTTGRSAALVEVPGTGHISTRYRVARWNEQGAVELSGAFPLPAEPLEATTARLVGITDRGDVVVRQQQWNGDSRESEVDFLVWKHDGTWSTLLHDYGSPWVHDAGSTTKLAADGSFVIRRNTYVPGADLVRPNADLTSATMTSLGPIDGVEIDAVSADGRWWVGREYTVELPPIPGDDLIWHAAFGAAKGLTQPLNAVEFHTGRERGPRALSINNQGTMVYLNRGVEWRNASRVTSVSAASVQRIPAGSVLPANGPYQIDTAGRIITYLTHKNGTCTAGVVAPQW